MCGCAHHFSGPALSALPGLITGCCSAPQEADIQRHRKRLISQGEIEDIAGGSFGPRRQQNLEESAATFEVTPCSLAAPWTP